MIRNTRWVPDRPAIRPLWCYLALVAGVFFGWWTSPTVAHAAESYGSQLERIARAAEAISRTLEHAAR